MVKFFPCIKTAFLCLYFLAVLSCQQQQKDKSSSNELKSETTSIEAITLLGDTLYTPKVQPGKSKDNYEASFLDYQKYPDSVEAIIWYGRRTGYLGHFQKAIAIYTEGIEKFPQEARLFRHRGHRYISTRQYGKAIADFERAAILMDGKHDLIEQDGLPNVRNIPIGTLKGNIWYHLGLAHYLNGDLGKALKAYNQREVTNRYDDNLVSGGHWLFMNLKRLGKDTEAQTAIADVQEDMDIIENTGYYEMCLFYKSLVEEQELNIKGDGSSSDDVYFYGLGNWYLYQTKDTVAAKRYYKKLLNDGNPYSFAYLAAEADWKRLFD